MRALCLTALFSALSQQAFTQDVPQTPALSGTPEPAKTVTIREQVPQLVIPKRVKASDTPSGLPVPRYVALKGKMNCRQGPSRDHKTLWQYRRRGLPLIVVAETERWRRVRDVNGDLCWVYAQGLTGARHAIVLEPLDILTRPKPSARLRARTERGAILALGPCRDGWCEVRVDGLKGWALQSRLWGAQPL